ncbi:MAG TPA: YicC/YloC family endoribonuclease [Gammaproteobacteria bacterium]|nr:YicC/YloC family endoribonuclease [Gammaproteobacteria bacterium]
MIHSMTAFTRHGLQQDWGVITWELRTVNHRYFELDFRLPESLRELEMPLRERASHYLHRGKVECHLKYKPTEANAGFSINQDLIQQLAKAGQEVRSLWGDNMTTSVTSVLSWPGVLQSVELDKEALHQSVLTLFDTALREIGMIRQREGLALQQRIEERLKQVLVEVDHIKQRLPVVFTHQRHKIQARIEEFKLAIDPQRLEEEVLQLMQKMDISEEVERLEIHVDEVYQSLKTKGAVGRRLDFLMQELHREANTLGSKSADAEVTHAAIRLKVLIEQMREQVQNVE